MVSPSKGKIIQAKESTPTAYDDILGSFRKELVRKVEASIQYSADNAANPTKQVYRVGVSDSVRPSPSGFSGAIAINGIPHYFKKSGAELTITGVFGPPTMILPDDGQVPQNAGDRVDGERSYWDVQGGTGIGPGAEAASIGTSVAHQIAQHTGMLSRVRKTTIIERMAVTSKNWNSKTYPATFEGKTIQAKGDTLVTFKDLYQFNQQGTKSGMANLQEPFRSALDWVIFAQTVAGDYLRTTVTDAGGNSPFGPQDTGEYITADGLQKVFTKMKGIWEEAKNETASVVIDYCHSSCHASCHSSRSRR